MEERFPRSNADGYYCPCCKQYLPASLFSRSALLCDDCFILQVIRDRKVEPEQEEMIER